MPYRSLEHPGVGLHETHGQQSQQYATGLFKHSGTDTTIQMNHHFVNGSNIYPDIIGKLHNAQSFGAEAQVS